MKENPDWEKLDTRTPDTKVWEDALAHLSSLLMFLQVVSGIYPELNFKCDALFLKFFEER